MRDLFSRLNLSGTDPKTIARTIIWFVSVVNAVLAMLGKVQLDVDEQIVYEIVSSVFVIVAGWRALWKNNSFTSTAQIADDYKEELLAMEDEEDEEE